jgi:hypothetical protein
MAGKKDVKGGKEDKKMEKAIQDQYKILMAVTK